MTRPGTGAGLHQLLFGGATALTLVGVVLAATRPEWLVTPLQAAVQGAGPAAPLVYLLLCIVAAPAHLCGLLGALSLVVWPLPAALGLTFVGTLLGSLLTGLALARLGGSAERFRAAWPAWLRRLDGQVERRAIVIGLLARLAIGSGAVLEAFFYLTGYSQRAYLISLGLGTALWTLQALLGVTLLHRLVQVSPGLSGLFALLPLLLVGGAVLLRRRQQRGRA